MTYNDVIDRHQQLGPPVQQAQPPERNVMELVRTHHILVSWLG